MTRQRQAQRLREVEKPHYAHLAYAKLINSWQYRSMRHTPFKINNSNHQYKPENWYVRKIEVIVAIIMVCKI